MNGRGRASVAASLRKAKRVPSTVWYFILILLCLGGAGLTARLLPVGATQTTAQSTDELWQEITTTASALNEPEQNVVVASPREPLATQGGNAIVEPAILAENKLSAIPFKCD